MKKLFIALVVVGLASVSQADVILGWDMSGQTGSQANQLAGTIDGDLLTTAGLNDLTRTGLNASSAANSFSSQNWNIGAFSDANDYISFTLQAASGFGLDLWSLDYRSNGSGTAPGTGRWGYRIGSGSWTYQTEWAMSTTSTAGSWDMADVTGITDSVEFRFWVYGSTSITGGASSTGGSGRLGPNAAGNDVVLNGTIGAIPEPTVLALLAIGGLAIVRFARRR